MTSPLNEPMTEKRALEIIRVAKEEGRDPYPPFGGAFPNIESEAKGYLERMEQEKPTFVYATCNPNGKHEGCGCPKDQLSKAMDAIEAADRMAEFISKRVADEFCGEDFDRLDSDIAAYRAARAKVGG